MSWVRALVLAVALAVLGGMSIPVAASAGRHHHYPRHADTVFLDGKVLLYEKRDRWASAATAT